MRTIVALAAIRDKRILLVEERGVWKLPGGTQEEGESELTTLNRELHEELPSIQPVNLVRYGEFEGTSVSHGDPLKIIVYRGDVEGSLTYSPDPDLNAVAWVQKCDDYEIWPTTRSIITDLQEKEYL